MKFEGISFNENWIASKTEEEFLGEASVNKHWFENDPNRDAKLKELYALVVPTPEAAPIVEESHVTQSENPPAGE